MRIVRLSEINSEMTLANPVYNFDGRILLNSGVALTNTYKNSLYKNGIIDIYVHDEFSEDIEIKTILNEKTKAQGKSTLKKFFDDIKKPKPGKKISLDPVSSAVDDMIEAVLAYQDDFLNPASLTMNYDQIFAHSLNVALISMFIGKVRGFNDLELHKLGMGAILHDIGKYFISEDLQKKNPLTERDKEFCSHPMLGYNTVKELDEISPLSKYVVYAHHERVDGKGYPNGTNGYKIHNFALIAAVANCFDLLQTNSP
ncbi:HD-GYP domain-containing protein [Pelotomaculum propionicicum]|uniref:Cyclic di-GMP phosphodiesterase response regulator RpfG n=1 Tax=Pelotomaculum propionicicum TaxID=258475 RepID=A0A4Y7RUI5_9FIRM|nr:HD domain-containing phosphohydrolase [Pelotomaculum propionicicum]TEB12399.1 Cyclic di-GMP phosphodiesterase response regulator RpfG [Pelotomaculum propionicicum]